MNKNKGVINIKDDILLERFYYDLWKDICKYRNMTLVNNTFIKSLNWANYTMKDPIPKKDKEIINGDIYKETQLTYMFYKTIAAIYHDLIPPELSSDRRYYYMLGFGLNPILNMPILALNLNVSIPYISLNNFIKTLKNKSLEFLKEMIELPTFEYANIPSYMDDCEIYMKLLMNKYL